MRQGVWGVFGVVFFQSGVADLTLSETNARKTNDPDCRQRVVWQCPPARRAKLASATRRPTSFESETSAMMPTACPPASRITETVRSTFSRDVWPLTTTAAPASARPAQWLRQCSVPIQ